MQKIAAALELYEEGEEAAARQRLLQLVRRYPRNKATLLALLEVSQEMDDWHTFAYYSEQLLKLERGEEQAETLNNLVDANMRLMYPALAWHYANERVVQHAYFEHIEEVKSLVATSAPVLLEEFEKTTDSTTISEGEKLERMALHDRMRFYTESGYPEDAIRVAELLLIAEAPDFRSAYNQLAVAYEMQEQEEKVRELVEETHALFPDYFFARVALARMMGAEKRIVEAKELVEPLLRLPKLHISEFRALAQVQMEIALADNQIDAARIWLEMWQQIEEDNPDLLEWKLRIDGPDFLKGLQSLLGRSRDRSSSPRRKR